MTEQPTSLHENGQKKGRSPEDKYGRYRWILIRVDRIDEKLRRIERKLDKLDNGLGSVMNFDSTSLQDTVCQDSLDLAILEVLRHTPATGILPKDIYGKVRRYGLQYHHISRRIKRMNKRLEPLGENVAVKVGARWTLSAFMRQNWGNKVSELEKAENEED